MLFLSMSRKEPIKSLQSQIFGIELRLDLFPHIDLAYIKEVLHLVSSPVLLTLRRASHGGRFVGTESEREELIRKLLALEPPFFDLEYDMDTKFLHEMILSHPKTRFILSYHNFEKTPEDLEGIYLAMQELPAFSYKIAAMAHSTNDALKMLLFVKSHPKTSAICMGEQGKFARVLAPTFGNLINYASIDLENQTAPGQLTFNELIDIYRYPFLNKNTSIYGLIGDPVEKSPGHLYHNKAFLERGENAVYVKMHVKPEELEEFISLAKTIGIRGLSVTIPLKEKIVPFIDEILPSAKQIGAINTLLFSKERIIGTNTDGIGALDAIEKRISVHGKHVVLIGAGGSSRAIAFEAKARGADVLILNRTVQKAKELAEDLTCKAGELSEVPEEYDLLIHCSSSPLPIDPEKIRPETLVMDIVYSPRETAFLQEASLKNCPIIYGEEMFLNQAAEQTAFWMAP